MSSITNTEVKVTIQRTSELVMHEVIESIIGFSEDYNLSHKETLEILNQNEMPLFKEAPLNADIIKVGIMHNNKAYFLFEYDTSKKKILKRYY